MITQQNYPQQNITMFKPGDRVETPGLWGRPMVGTVRRGDELNDAQRQSWEYQTGGDRILPDFLVVALDEPDTTFGASTLLSFAWDSTLTRHEPKEKEVFYVAHPVSGDIDANIANVIGWIHWLTVNDPSRIYIAPWIPEVLAFKDDPLVVQKNQATKDFYDRVLADDMTVVGKLDGILLVGGRISEGMSRELAAANKRSLTVQDWSYARTPADLTSDHIDALGLQ